MEAETVIAESRPMLEATLASLNMHNVGSSLDLALVLAPFSKWVENQSPDEPDVAYLSGLIGAFICEFLVQKCSCIRFVRNNRIMIGMRIQDGVVREFEPYAVAYSMALNPKRRSILGFIESLYPMEGKGSPSDDAVGSAG